MQVCRHPDATVRSVRAWRVTDNPFARRWPIMASFGETPPVAPPWPAPEQRARPAADGELPATCARFVAVARAAGHQVTAHLARGTAAVSGMVDDPAGGTTPTGRPKKVRSTVPRVVTSVVVRVELLEAPAEGRVGSIRAVWEDGSFVAAWHAKGTDPVVRVGASALRALL